MDVRYSTLKASCLFCITASLSFGTKHKKKLRRAPVETRGFKPSVLIFPITDIVMFSSLLILAIS